MNKLYDILKSILNDVQDDTFKYNNLEKNNGKFLAALCYIGFLGLIIYSLDKDNRFILYHINQGIKLFVCEIIGIIIIKISSFVFLDIILKPIILLIFLYLSLLGIVNAINGKARELPILNKFNVNKNV